LKKVNSSRPKGFQIRLISEGTKRTDYVPEQNETGGTYQRMTKKQLGELITDSQESLYRIAKTILASDADCADAVSETIVRAFSCLGTLKNDKYARTWLIRILINESRNIQRKGARIIPFDEIPEQEIHQTADYSELYQAVMTLPEEQRIAVALYYMEGYSIREIASMEDTTQSAVKNRLLRARRTLKTLLGNQLEDEE